jgi:ribosomal protein S18 acetylase RimI-like enzyme
MTPLEESNQQFIASWKVFCGRLPGGTADDLDGVVAVFGRVPVPFFNLCFLSHPVTDPDDLRRRVSAAVAYGSASEVPWFLALCEEWLPAGADSVCRDHGLGLALHLTGMAADALAQPRRALPNLAFTRVADAGTAEQIAAINTRAYGMPEEAGGCLAVEALWPADSFGYLGKLDGTPVTCAATVPVDDRLYVAWVATVPEHHRKGCAEAVMRHSLQAASDATGLRRTVLHATDAGLPVYQAMGFEVTSRFALYAAGGGEDTHHP